MMTNSKTNNMAGVIAKEGYETRVALKALERAGKCPNLHGHVHEFMFCDKYNFNPEHFLNGEHAQLTKSATAKMKDVIMMKGGKVIGHAQLKDTSSVSGAVKTVKQIKAGKYVKTRMMGTEETVAKIAGKTSQPVQSTGISSETTTRIAGKALGNMPTLGMVKSAAKSGGLAGAAFGAGIEAISSGIDYLDGKKDFDDVVIDVGAAAIKGGVTGAGSAVAGTAAAGLAGSVISTAAATGVGTAFAGTTIGAATILAGPVVVGAIATIAVGGLISSIFD